MNLEDLVSEELLLWELYRDVCEHRHRLAHICQEWWMLTERSSVTDF